MSAYVGASFDLALGRGLVKKDINCHIVYLGLIIVVLFLPFLFRILCLRVPADVELSEELVLIARVFIRLGSLVGGSFLLLDLRGRLCIVFEVLEHFLRLVTQVNRLTSVIIYDVDGEV